MVTAASSGTDLIGISGTPTAATPATAPADEVPASSDVFAQLLQGMGSEVAAAVSLSQSSMPGDASHRAAKPLKPMSAAEQAALSADMLALCGAPVPVTPLPVPALIAQTIATQPAAVQADAAVKLMPLTPTAPAVDAGESIAMASPPLQAQTQVQMPDQASAAATPLDTQWLQSMTNALMNKSATSVAASMPAQVVHTPVSKAESVDLNKLLKPESTAPSANMQPAVAQPLVDAAAQLPAAFAAQLRDVWKDDKTQASTAAIDAASNIATHLAQPTGTALANTLGEVQPRLQMSASVGGHQWATELGNKLTLLATNNTQSATLYMTPADLGPVQVRIDMNQTQASVWFTAEHADTRSALEQSLPRLREMFTAQGMSLTDAGVFGNRSGQQQAQQPSIPNQFASPAWAGDDAALETSMIRSVSLSMLDAYA